MIEWHDGDYPSDAALERIKKWPHDDVAGCLDFAKSLWHWPDFGVSDALKSDEAQVVGADHGDRFLRLATGGWSGNENIISALNSNFMVRAMCWQLTARGGLHIYKYPTRAAIDGGE